MQKEQLLCWSGMTDTEYNNIWVQMMKKKHTWRSVLARRLNAIVTLIFGFDLILDS